MADATPSEAGEHCPHCGAQCPPNVLVCPACGVHVAAYQAAQERLKEAQGAQRRVRLEELSRLSVQQGVSERTLERVRWKRQVAALFLGALVLALVIVAAAGIYARQRRLAAERLVRDYERATACLETGDYLCAREGFEAVARHARDHAQARAGLHTARLRLAQQYARAGQWEMGLDELDALLRDDPANEQALALAEEIFTRWHDDALAKGQWLMAVRIKAMRRARFPEETMPAPVYTQVPHSP